MVSKWLPKRTMYSTVNILLTVPGRCFFCGSFLLFMFRARLFIAALRSLAVKGLTSWLSCMRCFLLFLSLSHVVWYSIVSIPDLCLKFTLKHRCLMTGSSLSGPKNLQPYTFSSFVYYLLPKDNLCTSKFQTCFASETGSTLSINALCI